jgi:hypothetical protein
MRKLFSAAAVAVAMLSASAANAASLYFDFDEAQSSFQVTSSTPSCPFQPSANCQLTGALAPTPFTSVSIDEGDTYQFNFGQLFVGRGIGGDTNTQVAATLAFLSPDAGPVSSGGNVAYLTFLGAVSGGFLTWYNPVQQVTATDGSKFTVEFVNLAGVAFGGSTYAPVKITVDSVAAAAPEPAAWALMIGGFGMAGATLRRRRALNAA